MSHSPESISRSAPRAAVWQWFALDGVNQQGPFTPAEIRERLQAGALASHTLLWREGLTDWQPIAQVEEFTELAAHLPIVPFTNWQSTLDFQNEDRLEPSPTFNAQSVSRTKLASFKETALPVEETMAIPTAEEVERYANGETLSPPWPVHNSEHAWAAFHERQGLQPHLDEIARLASERNFFQKISQGWTKAHWFAASAIVVSACALTTIFIATSTTHIAPLPELTREENRELAAVAAEPIAAHGAGVAIAMSRRDPQAPEFVMASNLPDGTSLRVQIDGVSETLVDRFKVSVRANVTLKGGLARTPLFRQDGGAAYPAGDYRVSVWCASCEKSPDSQADARPLAQKTYFQPGVKSPDYQQRLLSYHERLRAQAIDELNELRQVAETLESQLSETITEFNKPTTQHRGWKAFDARWSEMENQLDAQFARWTPEALDSAYYHAPLYAALKIAGEQTRALHQTQIEFFKSDRGDGAAEAKIKTQGAELQKRVAQIKLTSQSTLDLPATAVGMPARAAAL